MTIGSGAGRAPAHIMCGRLRLLRIRFPDRAFVFAGDSGYGTHDVARFCDRHRAPLTRVSKLHPDARRFDPPPPYAGKGRPRVKGAKRFEAERDILKRATAASATQIK
ncbi:MAG TPA: hypothetical protein VGE74_11410 [Gemmata sp.]